MARVHEPAIIISEDAKLVALRTTDNDLAINRPAGSAFSLENWQEGYGIDEIVKPLKVGASPNDTQFECVEKLCTAREPGGLIVAYTDDPGKMQAACGEGDIVVLAFGAKNAGCSDPAIRVITQRDLALHGAMEINLPEPEEISNLAADRPVGPEPPLSDLSKAGAGRLTRLQMLVTTYAVGMPARPWNMYRTYSRAARNLAEYSSRRRPKPDDPKP